MAKEESPFIEDSAKAGKRKRITKEQIKDFLRWYFKIDVKDVWNWVLLALAILIFWWAIKMIIRAVSLP